jgi:hypothetical protein
MKKLSLNSAVMTVWLVIWLTVALAYTTGLVPNWGQWYSRPSDAKWAPNFRSQTDAFFHGRISLDSSPYGLRNDLVWDKGGVQQVWGLGVPAFRFIFEVLARATGFDWFPDRITFLIAYAACAFFVVRTFIGRMEDINSSNERSAGLVILLGTFVSLLFIMAPPFVTLLRTTFDIYEEVAAYSYLYGIFLFALFVRVGRQPTLGKVVFLALWAGIGPIIRPTLVFYGAIALALIGVLVWRSPARRRLLVSMISIYGLCGIMVCFSNWWRFGSPVEFGHRLNICYKDHNVFQLRFGCPWEHEPITSAAIDEFGSLFFVQHLNGDDYYAPNCVAGQSPTYHWHNMYFSTFDWLYLLLGLASVGFWLVNWKRFRTMWRQDPQQRPFLLAVPWSVLSFLCLFAFYLWSPSMSSRYILDFLPAAMAGLAALVFNWQALSFGKARRPVVAVASIGVATVAFLFFEIAHADIFPNHKGPTATVGQYVVEPPLSDRQLTNSLHDYEANKGDDQFQEIPCNGTYWELTNGVVRAAVTLFVNDPECATLSLFSLSGAPLTKADLDPIRAKIGLEYLSLQEVNISSNKATMIFRGPKSARYQRGLQICFLGFIRPEDLGQREPTVGMTSISFTKTGALSAERQHTEEIARRPDSQAGKVSAESGAL